MAPSPHFLAALAQAAPPRPGTAGGATLLLGAAVGAAIVLLFIVARMGRRWVMHDTTVRRPNADPRSRVDPWFEAGRRMNTPTDDGERST